ncbi:hypothetical protein Leryth_011025 [Lithospermum erythrorhizon]|nr:hypothetical protein Leryth_011025 [Lithospermum erythrorhizon]
MATGAAGDGLFRGVFEGCISSKDTGISRRPYHRNCTCELHKKRGHCSHVSKCNNITYPIRKSWSEGCLSLMATSTTTSNHSSPSTSLAQPSRIPRKSSMIFIPEDQD